MLRIMRAATLRTVLLVKAIEETDRQGEILPLADRTDATRAAHRSGPPLSSADTRKADERALRLLAARAQRLHATLTVRHPVLRHVANFLEGVGAFVTPLLVFGVLLGLALAAFERTDRVDILAFPLAGLLGWNLLVYALLIGRSLRSAETVRRGSHASRLLARLTGWRTQRWLSRSAQFSVPLAAALRRFEADWSGIGRPLLLARTRRLLHVAAMAVAAGLVLGLYVRGIVFDYDAGWESTFLGPRSVLAIVGIVYGPAATVTGIALPASVAEMSALRWDAPAAGADAAPWIHLISATIALYVMLPRLALTLLETARLARLAWRPAMPATLLPYARSVLGLSAEATTGASIAVTPCAHELSGSAQTGLEALLHAACGADATITWQEPLRYGEEVTAAQRFEAETAGRANAGTSRDWEVLVFNLAATPEAENHGMALAAVRDVLARRAQHTLLLIVLDESTYAARLQGNALTTRLNERRAAWQRFVAGYGLRACAVDLAQLPRPLGPSHPAVESARAALGSAAA